MLISGCTSEPVNNLNSNEDCDIKTDDPEGYLLKICQYLNEHKDSVIPNKNPDDYKIKKIEEGIYPGEIPLEYGDTEVIKIYLDCCFGAGDIAYFNKQTKEVIYFSPGDV